MVNKIDKGIIIILDVGKNVRDPDGKDQKTFFEKSKQCVARIIESKILSQPKDYLGVILLGSRKSLNNMAENCDGAFRYIETYIPLQPPTWKMIKDLPESPSTKCGDWVEALAVAVDHVRNEISGVKIANVKILLMTNFQAPTSSKKNLPMVLDGMKNEKIEVDVIGVDISDENIDSFDLKWARAFVEETNGMAATFHDIMNYLTFHKKKLIRPSPWNVELSIGPHIKIPVTSYVRLNDDKVVEKWKKSIRDLVTSKSSSTEGIVRDPAFYKDEDQTKVDDSDVGKGLKFGGQTVPSYENDKSELYQSGYRSLSLYGFTLASNIHCQHLDGKGLSYLFGRPGDKKAQQAITCLTEVLHENKLVGIIRKVHNKNNAPKMFVLMPVIDTNNYVCLSMISLCYKEAIKYMSFPPTNIKKYPCTKDQVDAFKDLIKAMDLNNAYDETFDNSEAFPIGETVNPSAQYLLDCIAFRALNPGQPLPPPRDNIMNLFKIPPRIEERSQTAQERIKKLFLLQKVQPKTKRRVKTVLNFDTSNQTTSDMKSENDGITDIKIKLPEIDISDNNIRTINPVKDFSELLKNGKSLTDLAPEMVDVIESLLYFDLDGTYRKAIDAITCFRNECVKIDPTVYNNWLLKFKVDLANRNRHDLQQLIQAKEVDFILKSENNLSTFETIHSHDESQLYEIDTAPESTEIVINQEVNDMFDDM